MIDDRALRRTTHVRVNIHREGDNQFITNIQRTRTVKNVLRWICLPTGIQRGIITSGDPTHVNRHSRRALPHQTETTRRREVVEHCEVVQHRRTGVRQRQDKLNVPRPIRLDRRWIGRRHLLLQIHKREPNRGRVIRIRIVTILSVRRVGWIIRRIGYRQTVERINRIDARLVLQIASRRGTRSAVIDRAGGVGVNLDRNLEGDFLTRFQPALVRSFELPVADMQGDRTCPTVRQCQCPNRMRARPPKRCAAHPAGDESTANVPCVRITCQFDVAIR